MKVEDVVANVHWPSKPVTRTAPAYKLIRVQPYHPVYGWVINHQVTRLWVHWDGSQGIMHLEDEKRCEGCRFGMPLMEKGYLPILLHSQPKIVIVELREISMRADNLLSSEHAPLRGRDIRVERATAKSSGKQHKRSPIKVTWGNLPSPKTLPSPIDIRASLVLIYQMIPNRFGEAKNALPEGGTP